MHRAWLIIPMLFMLGAGVPDTPAPEKAIGPGAHEAATRLAKVMGTEDIMLQRIELMKGQIAAAINKQNPAADGSKAVDEIIMPEVRKRSGELTELVVNVWASHFNIEELEQMRAFYETPVGQKSVRELPVVMEEARKAGSDWGRQMFLDILKERAADLHALGIGVGK
jgi:hypothetical protein